jgi:hypothetical protein
MERGVKARLFGVLFLLILIILGLLWGNKIPNARAVMPTVPVAESVETPQLPEPFVADVPPFVEKPRERTIEAIPIAHPFSVQVKRGKMLYAVSSQGVALIDFTAFGVAGYGPNSGQYRWRFRSNVGGLETAGTGIVFEKYEKVTEGPQKGYVKDVGSQLALEVGPLSITWSHGGSGAAWIYFPANVTHYNLLNSDTYDSFGIGSGEKSGMEF